MEPTEGQLVMWLVYAGAGGGLVWSAAFIRAVDTRDPGCLLGVAMGMGGGAITAIVAGAILGFTVRLYDVAGDPGLGRAIVYGFMGFLVGGISGIPGGALGGALGDLLKGKKR